MSAKSRKSTDVEEVTKKTAKLSVGRTSDARRSQEYSSGASVASWQPTKMSLKEWWDAKSSTIVGDRSAVPIAFFSHCTSSDNKKQINDDRKIKGCGPDFGQLAATGFKGVYFMASLFVNAATGEADLPTQSPFGTQRIRIPISSIVTKASEWSMYFELAFKTKYQNKHGKSNYHIRLVLVKRDNKEAKKFCDDNLKKLNLSDNPFLKWESDGRVTAREIYNAEKEGLFTSVFVVGDVETVKWDKVEQKGEKPQSTNLNKKFTPMW